ncbi:MAG: hypothetical protein V7K18_02040 [Nostoc sp.]|uniref:hypothetical protein n=1 Tax=Nostoc sp. TaxID=1180 RepID=UPI002FF9C6A2
MSDNTSDRLALIQLLYDLPPQQLNTLIIAIKVPNEVMPAMNAPHGDRTFALIQWAEGSTGCGIEKLQSSLNCIQNSQINIPEPEKLKNTLQIISRTELTPNESRNRESLLNKVNNIWIKGVLENSFYKQFIELRLEERLELVAPWKSISSYGQKKFYLMTPK